MGLCLGSVEARVRGFAACIRGVAGWTPEDMERVEQWPGGSPMYLDMARRGPALLSDCG